MKCNKIKGCGSNSSDMPVAVTLPSLEDQSEDIKIENPKLII